MPDKKDKFQSQNTFQSMHNGINMASNSNSQSYHFKATDSLKGGNDEFKPIKL